MPTVRRRRVVRDIFTLALSAEPPVRYQSHYRPSCIVATDRGAALFAKCVAGVCVCSALCAVQSTNWPPNLVTSLFLSVSRGSAPHD